MHNRFWRRWRMWIAPAFVYLCASLPHLDQGGFRADTSLYAAVGVQAWRTGTFAWLETEPGFLYANKPPLALLVHGLVVHAAGVHLWAARLPTVLVGLACVVLTVAIARHAIGRRGAQGAGIVLALSYEFFRRSREISLDLWQLMFMLAAVALAMRASRSRRWRWWLATGAMIGLALLCKPLVALVALVMLGAWSLVERRGDALVGSLLAALSAVIVAAPWHMFMAARFGDAFTGAYFGREVAARAAGDLSNANINAGVWTYYLRIIAETYWPWLVFAVWGLGSSLVFSRRPRSASQARCWAIWLIGWLVLLSSFADQRPRYAVMIYPALAYFAGVALARVRTPPVRRLFDRVATLSVPVSVLACVGLWVAPIRVQDPPEQQWGELFAWMRANPAAELCKGGLTASHASRVYLESGRWPTPIASEWTAGRNPRAGDYLLYHRRDGLAPGANEPAVLVTGKLIVTRLASDEWSPTPIADPGED